MSKLGLARFLYRLTVASVGGAFLSGCQSGPEGSNLSTASPTAANCYAAVNGSDQWSGRLDQPDSSGQDGPFATLARARDAVRQAVQRGAKQDILVLIRGGSYRLDETVVFSMADSAPAGLRGFAATTTSMSPSWRATSSTGFAARRPASRPPR